MWCAVRCEASDLGRPSVLKMPRDGTADRRDPADPRRARSIRLATRDRQNRANDGPVVPMVADNECVGLVPEAGDRDERQCSAASDPSASSPSSSAFLFAVASPSSAYAASRHFEHVVRSR